MGGLNVSMPVTGATVLITYQGSTLELPYEVAIGELLPELAAARTWKETPAEPWSKPRRPKRN